MTSQIDLDQGGTNRQWVRKYLGASLGWASVPNESVIVVTTGGTTTLQNGVSLVLVNVASAVTLQLPSAVASLAGPQAIVYGYEMVPITVVDLGGNAGSFNITILPFGSELIDGVASATIMAAYNAVSLLPTTTGGWTLTANVAAAGLTTTAAGFTTRTSAAAATIASGIQVLLTGGYASIGDGGDAEYVRTSGSTTGGFQSADGQWWEIVPSSTIKAAAFGAKNDNVTDVTTLLAAALTYLSSNYTSGILQLQSGNPYLVSSALTVPNSVTIEGTGVGNCSVMSRTDATVFNVTGDYAQLKNFTVLGKGSNSDTGTFGATQPAVIMAGVEARMTHMRVEGGAPTIKVTTDDAYLDDVTAVFSYGNSIIECTATTFMSRNKIDQAWPQSQPANGTNFAARGNTTSYAQGVVVSMVGPDANTWYIQKMNAGSQNSGGSPPTLLNYERDITDGSVTWRIVGRSDMDCLRISGNEFHGWGTDISGVGRFGIAIEGGVQTFINGFIIGQQWGGSVLGDTGSSLYLDQCELNVGINTNTFAVQTGGSWTGDLCITNCTIFGVVGTSCPGIDLAGGVDSRIIGNYFKNCTTGVQARANIGNIIISNNTFKSCTVSIDINGGTGDHINITNNLINTSSVITDNSTGLHKFINGNV